MKILLKNILEENRNLRHIVALKKTFKQLAIFAVLLAFLFAMIYMGVYHPAILGSFILFILLFSLYNSNLEK